LGRKTISFRLKKAAEEMVAKEGGEIMSYQELTPKKLYNKYLESKSGYLLIFISTLKRAFN